MFQSTVGSSKDLSLLIIRYWEPPNFHYYLNIINEELIMELSLISDLNRWSSTTFKTGPNLWQITCRFMCSLNGGHNTLSIVRLINNLGILAGEKFWSAVVSGVIHHMAATVRVVVFSINFLGILNGQKLPVNIIFFFKFLYLKYYEIKVNCTVEWL